jgi:hypothetical protein
MQTPPSRKLWSLIIAGLLILLSALLVIPATGQAVYGLFGIDTSSKDSIAYNGFEPFIPFVPGYFPDNFEITHVSTGSHLSPEIDTYTETYASDSHFFLLIQSQGEAVPPLYQQPGLTVQDHPANLAHPAPNSILPADDLDLSLYDLTETWVLTVVLREINILVVTNLPREEALNVADGLVPAICTSTPTPEN